MNAKQITKALIDHFRMRAPGTLLVPNVYMPNSPWESDLVRISKKYYWTEYEVKITVADFKKDFDKQTNRINPNSPFKHDLYASPDPIARARWDIPKPKHFYFVVPEGLLDSQFVPRHCGILEVKEPTERNRWNRVKTKRFGKTLKSHNQLDIESIYRLAVKNSLK